MGAFSYYATIILVYMGTDLISAWGLNLEFGVTGIPNLAYIVFVACGAYTYAVLTVGPSSQFGGAETYIIGGRVPAGLAIVAAVVVSGVLGTLIGLTGLRRLRLDYQALTLLIISFIATGIVGADSNIFNGLDGLSLIPNPLEFVAASSRSWVYVGLVAVLCIVTLGLVRRFTGGPLGRALRAVRDDEEAAMAIGKSVLGQRLLVQGIGGALAGLSGALLVGFIGGWSPAAWGYLETLALLTAIIIGGRGNNLGVFVGTILLLGAFLQGVQYLPAIGNRPDLIFDIGWIVVGALTIAFLFLRPQGIFPERRPRYAIDGADRDAGAGRWARLLLANPTARTGTTAINEPGRAADAGTDDELEAETVEVGVDRGHALAAVVAAHGRTERVSDYEDVLVVENIARSFGGVHAVDGASFRVPKGSIVGLIGPNGAGKSTALGIISGFIRPDVGSITYAGEDVTRLAAYRRARRGLVRTFQLTREFGKLTLLDNLMVAARGHRGETVFGALAGRRYWRGEEAEHLERAERLLELFGVTHQANKLAANLSGGQKRMLEMMRALMLDPELLLLDEPMAGLSAAVSERVEQACLGLRESGVAVLLIEHELAAVERLCSNVVVMAQGKVLVEGEMANLRRSKLVQEAYFVG
jgi:branched-chain amino acid transport system permease protein